MVSNNTLVGCTLKQFSTCINTVMFYDVLSYTELRKMKKAPMGVTEFLK